MVMPCIHWKWSLVFLFGHLIFVWWNQHAWHFGILSIFKIQHPPFQKKDPRTPCFQLHDHCIDRLSSSTSIHVKCCYNYPHSWCMNLKRPHLAFVCVNHQSPRLVHFFSSSLCDLVSLLKEWCFKNYLTLLKKLEINSSNVHCYILYSSCTDKEELAYHCRRF